MNKLIFLPFKQANIKNIIFDLGGVVLDIDYSRTLAEFNKLGVKNLESHFTFTTQTELFNRLDCGIISPANFIAELRTNLGESIRDYEMVLAWNALLLDWNLERLNLIQKLRNNYGVFLLSNTNIIHSNVYNNKLKQLTGGNDLKYYFDKVYYSYEVGLRKPNPEIFKLVISENNLKTEETLFIDDTFEHIDSAQKLGFLTYNISPKSGETITQLFE